MRQTFSEYHDPDEHLGLVGEDRADEYARPDRRLPMMLLTVAAMALFAGGLWFAYVQGTRHPAVIAPGDAVIVGATAASLAGLMLVAAVESIATAPAP